MHKHSTTGSNRPQAVLSDDQETFLQMVADGLPRKAVTKKLGIPNKAFDNLSAAVKQALNARNLPHAVKIAFSRGYLR